MCFLDGFECGFDLNKSCHFHSKNRDTGMAHNCLCDDISGCVDLGTCLYYKLIKFYWNK